jgi:hypothetical protein
MRCTPISHNSWIIGVESFENNVNKLNNYCYDEKEFQSANYGGR